LSSNSTFVVERSEVLFCSKVHGLLGGTIVSGVVAFSQEFVRAVSQSSQVMIDRRHWYYSAYFRSVMVAIVSISVADVVVFPWNFSFIYEKLCKVFQVDQQTPSGGTERYQEVEA
jgi:hypothetical protein